MSLLFFFVFFYANYVDLPSVITSIVPSFPERDAFDTLFDHAPDKLNVVKRVSFMLCHCNANPPWC